MSPVSSNHQHLIDHSAPAIYCSISGQGLNIIENCLLRIPALSKADWVFLTSAPEQLRQRFSSNNWMYRSDPKTMRKRLKKIQQLLTTGNLIQQIPVSPSCLRFVHARTKYGPAADGLKLEGINPSFTHQLPQPHYFSTPSSNQRQLYRSAQPMLTSMQLKTNLQTIIDKITMSTWRKFLTKLRPGEGGMMQPAPMVCMEFFATPSDCDSLQPRLPLAATPFAHDSLRPIYVDQDSVDFLNTFFSFQKSPSSSAPISSIPDSSNAPPPNGGIFSCQFFYKSLEFGVIEFDQSHILLFKKNCRMDSFHFEGSDMVLRYATLRGVSGYFFQMRNEQTYVDTICESKSSIRCDIRDCGSAISSESWDDV
ncbi:hypothetical protein VP01_2286g6 [Puccinia sorghi]|uniref:Uncharacterized protein n=1 Tax=Puccinia sorghi TaxID=27349 RepID=A0A0L6V889_9BASI|nr:hypothetical protein VP01_2286g6 [Puccinia sorghi]